MVDPFSLGLGTELPEEPKGKHPAGYPREPEKPEYDPEDPETINYLSGPRVFEIDYSFDDKKYKIPIGAESKEDALAKIRTLKTARLEGRVPDWEWSDRLGTWELYSFSYTFSGKTYKFAIPALDEKEAVERLKTISGALLDQIREIVSVKRSRK